MNEKRTFFKTSKLGLALFAAFLGTLTGCVGYVDRAQPGEVYEASPSVQTTFLVVDDYVYYPNYECYYSASRHQYAYRDGGRWISRPAPHGVSVRRLQASPSVRMEFHDSPAQHHEAVTKQYPKNWKPAAAKPVQKENRKDDRRDEHKDNGR